MTIYNEIAGGLIGGSAVDPQGFPVTIRKINGNNITWSGVPLVLSFQGGRYIARVNEDRSYTLEAVDDGDNPANAASFTVGTCTFTLWNGVAEGVQKTHTFMITGATTLVDTGFVSAGLVAKWEAATAVFSGSNLTSWVDSVSSRALTLVGVPTKGTPLGGTAGQTVVIGSNQGFTFDCSGFPTGNTDRTLQMLWKPTGTQKLFGGFGYGTSLAGQAFTLSVDNAGQLALDISGSRYLIGVTPTNQWNFMTARLQNGTLTVWLGLNKVFTATGVSLNTVLTRGNVCRSFSNKSTTAEIGAMLAYGRALTDAEIVQNCLAANAAYIADTTVTAPGAPSASNLAPNSFTISGSVGESYGSYDYAVKAGTGTMLDTEVDAGTAALAFGQIIFSGTTAWSVDISGAVNSTAYRAHGVFYDMVGGKSAVVSSSTITTLAPPDTTPPQITPTATYPKNSGTTTIDYSFGLDELSTYIVGMYSATAADPTEAQVVAGVDGGGNPLLYSFAGSVSAAGTVTGTATGGVPSTLYKIVVRAQDLATPPNVSLYISPAVSTGAVPQTTAQLVDSLNTFTISGGVGLSAYNTGLIPVAAGLPAGWAIERAGDMIYPTQDNPTPLVGYDLSGFQLFSNGQSGGTVRYCKVGPNTATWAANQISLPAGRSRQGYHVWLSPGSSNWTVEYCDSPNFYGNTPRDPAFFGQTYSGTGTLATDTGTGNVLRRCRFWNYTNDGIHLAGGGILVEENWAGVCAQYNRDILPYTGNPGDYVNGDAILIMFNGLQYAMVCIVASGTATIAPVPDGNAEWQKWSVSQAHTDLVNPRAAITPSGGGAAITLRKNYFNADATSGHPFNGLRVGAINNLLRIVPNSGQNPQFAQMDVSDNVFRRNPITAASTIQVTYESNAVGPFNFTNNRIWRRKSVSFWSYNTAQIGTWSGNTSETGSVLAQP